MDFWTREQYLRFAEAMMDEPIAYYCLEVLSWFGTRLGELLALTPYDIDFKNRVLNIDKNYQVVNGKEYCKQKSIAEMKKVPQILRD